MDNNFNENKPDGNETEVSADNNVNASESASVQQENTPLPNRFPPPPPMYGGMPLYEQQQYGQPFGNIPPQNMAGPFMPPPPVQPVKAKRFTGAGFWISVSLIAVMFTVIIILIFKISKMPSVPNIPEIPGTGISTPAKDDAEKAPHVVLEIPTSSKPVLEEELYRDKDKGLLTTVGVAKVILPSQVQIKIFSEVPYAPIATGSGIILTEDGYIVTNAHVVDGAVSISAAFSDDTENEAVLVGFDKKSDLAVVKVDRTDLTPAVIGTSSELEIGEEVALAGAGGGYKNTVNYGHVTGLEREIDTDYMSSASILCIQSDAALNPGNSGGALVNMYGQVVGVPVVLMNHERYDNIGFSIAIDDAVPIIEDLIARGYVSSRTRVGISYLSIGDVSASEYGVPAGLCVMEIDPSCGVADTDIRPYDIITSIDETRVFGAQNITEALAGKVPGDKIKLSVFRKEITGKTYIFEAEVELSPDPGSVSGYSANAEAPDFYNRDILQ